VALTASRLIVTSLEKYRTPVKREPSLDHQCAFCNKGTWRVVRRFVDSLLNVQGNFEKLPYNGQQAGHSSLAITAWPG
jgi:hypothetical protein